MPGGDLAGRNGDVFAARQVVVSEAVSGLRDRDDGFEVAVSSHELCTRGLRVRTGVISPSFIGSVTAASCRRRPAVRERLRKLLALADELVYDSSHIRKPTGFAGCSERLLPSPLLRREGVE